MMRCRFIWLRKITFYRFEKHFFHVALTLSLFFVHATFMDIALSYSYYRYGNRNYFIEYENSRYAVECFEAVVFPINYVIIVLGAILFWILLLYLYKYLLYKIDEYHIKKTKALIKLSQFVLVASIIYTIISSYLAGLTWYDGDTNFVFYFYNSFSEASSFLIYVSQFLLMFSLIPIVVHCFKIRKVKKSIAIWFGNSDSSESC